MLDFGMVDSTSGWSYAATLARLALALGLGMLTGIERERRHKKAGPRCRNRSAIETN